MDIFNILTMVGGLALFLYGMHVMGEGLSKASGGRLERILENLTSNPVKAVLLGAGVTAVIQSSSATTVMVVGFVNSGIMKLSQAIGIIMGANVGTTVTSWILSLAGLEGNSIFIKLLKPMSFTPILAIIGVSFIMFSKSERKKDIGTILIGFAVLMFGMDTMSNAVKPLADVPEFTKILTMFSNRRGDPDGRYSKFFGIRRYFTGIVRDRINYLFFRPSYYNGAEYRNLYYGAALFRRGKQKCKAGGSRTFVF